MYSPALIPVYPAHAHGALERKFRWSDQVPSKRTKVIRLNILKITFNAVQLMQVST